MQVPMCLGIDIVMELCTGFVDLRIFVHKHGQEQSLFRRKRLYTLRQRTPPWILFACSPLTYTGKVPTANTANTLHKQNVGNRRYTLRGDAVAFDT